MTLPDLILCDPQDWLILQRLRMENPCEQPVTGQGDRRGRVMPLYPRVKSLGLGYVGRDFNWVSRNLVRDIDKHKSVMGL